MKYHHQKKEKTFFQKTIHYEISPSKNIFITTDLLVLLKKVGPAALREVGPLGGAAGGAQRHALRGLLYLLHRRGPTWGRGKIPWGKPWENPMGKW